MYNKLKSIYDGGVRLYPSFEEVHTDRRHLQNLLNEGLNTNKVLDYIQVENNKFIVDMGVVGEQRRLYLVYIESNELSFVYINLPKEYGEALAQDGFSLDSFFKMFHTFVDRKGSEVFNQLIRYENMNLNFDSGMIKTLFNTVYKIALEYCKTNGVHLLYFRADTRESSRVSIYNMLYRSFVKDPDIEGLGDFETEDEIAGSIEKALDFVVGYELIDGFKTYVVGVYL